MEELMAVLKDDLAVRQYFVTGDITQAVFADDCRFKDPTNDIVGLARYVKALTILFDPANSSVEFLDIAITGPNTIESSWTLGGTLKLPWKPVIDRIEGHTTYTINADGLVQIQDQEWSISPFKALGQTFNPF